MLLVIVCVCVCDPDDCVLISETLKEMLIMHLVQTFSSTTAAQAELVKSVMFSHVNSTKKNL